MEKEIPRCYCEGHSCETVTSKKETVFSISTEKRFCFIKEDNCIIKGGIVENDILTCRENKTKAGEVFFDNVGDFTKFLKRKNKDPEIEAMYNKNKNKKEETKKSKKKRHF